MKKRLLFLLVSFLVTCGLAFAGPLDRQHLPKGPIQSFSGPVSNSSGNPVLLGLFSRLFLEEDLVDGKGELTSGLIERDSAASYIDTSGVLQIADGDSTPFSHSSIEDETGYTSMRGSFVDGQAWFWVKSRNERNP